MFNPPPALDTNPYATGSKRWKMLDQHIDTRTVYAPEQTLLCGNSGHIMPSAANKNTHLEVNSISYFILAEWT